MNRFWAAFIILVAAVSIAEARPKLQRKVTSKPVKKAAPKPLVTIEDVLMKSGVILEESTGRILWSRDKDTPRYPASTTKIMTTLLLLENTKPDDVLTAPADVDRMKEASMNLKPFEKVRALDLAHALMLRSANDGCYTVAMHLDGSIQKFAERMNKRAEKIGCLNTHFNNPSGLNDAAHTISAYDLVLIAREAMKRPDFRQIVKTKRKLIDRSINIKDRTMVNRNKYLWRDQTADGVKTGWTVPSGHTYVGSVTRNGMRVFTSLLDSPRWLEEHSFMVKYAFANFEKRLLCQPGQMLTKLSHPAGAEIEVEPIKPVYLVWSKRSGRSDAPPTFEWKSTKNAPIPAGAIAGTLLIRHADYSLEVPVISRQAIGSVSLAGTTRKSGPGWPLFAVAGVGSMAWYLRRSQARKSKKVYG